MGNRLSILAFAAVLTVLLLAAPHPAAWAQDDACPALALEAITTLDTSCAAVGRNEVCYGNVVLAAEFWSDVPDDFFSAPSDIAGAAQVRAISGAAMNIGEQVWGLGLMRLQADIPDTLPGQAVNFLLIGDTSVENLVPEGEARQEVSPVAVSASAAANLRSGPGLNFSVVGSVPAGTELQAVGVNDAGDWLEVETGTLRAWISAALVTAADGLAALPQTSGRGASLTPLEVFSFETGFGDPLCNEALPDHLLVNSPEGLSVAFTANGVEFALASTGALRSEPGGNMTITVFEGTFSMNYTLPDGTQVSVTVPAGFEVDIPVNENNEPIGPPSALRPLDESEWTGYEGIELPELFGDVIVQAGEEDDAPPPVIQPPQQPAAQPPAQPQGGAGSVQATLRWTGGSDLDLAVTDPTGTTIYYGNRAAPSGGVLDTDSNYPCGQGTSGEENVTWASGAPAGVYNVQVGEFPNPACPTGDVWALTVLVDGALVLNATGVGPASYIFSVP